MITPKNDGLLLRYALMPWLRWALVEPVARILRRAYNTVLQVRDGLWLMESKEDKQRQMLARRMINAETMEQWLLAAKQLDILQGNEAWKSDNLSTDFDAPLILAELAQLDEARMKCDVKKMILLVRTTLSRDLGGMGDIKLYQHSYVGTKDLIDRYINSTLDTIRLLATVSKQCLPEGIEIEDILEQVICARQAFGRSALLLSGGATLGMSHVGVLKTLFEEKLLPRIISGASAGSIVCAVLGTRTDEEIHGTLKAFPSSCLTVFGEGGNRDSILDRTKRLLTQGALIDIKHLIGVLQRLLGDMTFQEAYNRTRRVLNICVSPASIHELPRLLNYITAPNVMIWSAVAASCSVPVLFSATQLLTKNPVTGQRAPWNPTPRRWIDGSVDNDLPMNRLAEMFNVNHFIVSQVNPHVVPFLADHQVEPDAQTDKNSGPGGVYFLTNLAKEEVSHRMHMLSDLGIFPNLFSKARSVLTQKYSGDITILPKASYKDFCRILKNPTPEFMVRACHSGERATWPRLSRIRNQCAVELALDAAIHALRARVSFSPNKADLQRVNASDIQSNRRYDRRLSDGIGSTPVLANSGRENTPVNLRPPLRTVNSHWTVRQHTLSSASLRSTSTPSTPTTPTTSDPLGRIYQTLDISSEGEMASSVPSPGADVDCTRVGSPEADMADTVEET